MRVRSSVRFSPMGRPSLDLGTAGTVRVYPVASGGFNAETRFRDGDGKIRRVERRGPTRSAASRALRLAVRDRIHTDFSSELSGESKLRDLAQVYLNDIKSSDRSPSTIAQYEDRLNKQILPALADVRLRELTVGRVDQFLQHLRIHHGPSLARMTRSVLSGMCALAARRDAMQFNPVRDTTPIRAKPANPAQPLGDFELGELRQTLLASERARDLDVIDLVLFMIATGCRVGEALALKWTEVNLANRSVEIRTTAIRVKGQGVLIKNSPKTSSSRRTLELPAWCVDIIALRPRAGSGLVFPAPRSGSVRDPSNTIKAIHRALGQNIKYAHLS